MHRQLWRAAAVMFVAGQLGAQTTQAPSPAVRAGFARLRADGNDLPQLRRPLSIELDQVTVTRALQTIAGRAGLNLTFDPLLPELEERVSLAAGQRSVAQTLLLVLARTALAIEVSPTGQLVVVSTRAVRSPAIVITGRVVDSASTALAGATVRVLDSPLIAVVDESGRFVLRGVPPGRVVLRAHLLGYLDGERAVLTAPGDSVDVVVRLVVTALRLGAIRTEGASARRASFEDRPSVGVLSVSGGALRNTPRVGEPDLLRAVQLLPGVGARNDYSTALSVRGGESDQNLVLLDGYPIYNPFHLGGLFSTFITSAVADVSLLSGGFPAAYGGRLSSVLDVRSVDDDRAGIHGTADVSLLATTATLSGAMNRGRGSWMIAGRRTYADKIANAVRPNALPYHFQDVQGRFAHSLPGGGWLSMTLYSGLDVLEEEPDADLGSSTDARFAWGNRVLGATVTKTFANRPTLFGIPLGDSVSLVQRLSTSRFHMGLAAGPASESQFHLHSDVDDRRLGGSLTAHSARHDRTIGYEVASQRLSYGSNAAVPGIQLDSLRQRAGTAGVFYDDLWRLTPSLLVQAGGRLDYASGREWSGFSPRLSAKYFLTPDLALTAATGKYAQSVHSLGREDVPLRLFDFWLASDSALPVSRAWHYVVGLERRVTPSRTLRIEGFYKTYEDLLEANLLADPNVGGDEFVVGSGRSYGVDVMLQQFEQGRFSGWVAYTYALSSRIQRDGQRYFPGQDRRHDLNLVGNWRWPKYTIAARFGLATGTPYSNVLGEFHRRRYDPSSQSIGGSSSQSIVGGGGDLQFLNGSRNGERLPITQRLDVSVTRNAHLGDVSVSPYLSIVNLYNARNTLAYVFNYQRHPPTRTTVPQFPILPSIGVNVAW